MSLPYFTFASGTLLVVGKQPDGDSVRFVPDDKSALSHIYRAHLLRPSKDGSHQLRLEGIDAPETHYSGHAQPLGDEARDHFLKQILGFRELAFSKETVSSATPRTIPGSILTQAADVHGRPIAYLFVGAVESPFGKARTGFVTADMIRKTTNYAMLAGGLAYCLLYTSTPREHREAFSAAAKQARQEEKSVWLDDRTARFDLDRLESGTPEAEVIFPKLFRRAVDYATAVRKGFSGDFVAWLQSKSSEDDRVVIDDRDEVPLSVLVRQENDRYRLDLDTTDAVFVEK